MLEDIYHKDRQEGGKKKKSGENLLRSNVFIQINIFYDNYIDEIIDLIMKIDLVVFIINLGKR